MSLFPKEKLVVESGVLRFKLSDSSIEIRLKPFSLPETDEIQTSFRLDFISFQTRSAQALAHASFKLPVNPEDGYIDASIYIESSHHPVDVTEIQFGELVNGFLEIRIQARTLLSFEGLPNQAVNDEYEDFDLILRCNLEIVV